jgi:hypothetical protein
MQPGGGAGGGHSEVLFEFTKIGNQMRVAAFDVETGVEIVMIAPLAASQHQMRTFALAKLKRRLEQSPK